MTQTLTLESACAPYRSLAIAGTAKNAGKTTALNYLIERFTAAGRSLGLSSIGRDGEAVDQITNRPKPRIRPPVGALVATSHESALYSQATLTRVAETPFRTALGPVGIYRVASAGYVEVAGPVKVKEAASLMRQLEAMGCDHVLLDGAADRRAFLSAGVDAFVLATGLAVDLDPAAVIAHTRDVLTRLQLPRPSAAWQTRLANEQMPGALVGEQFIAWEAPSFIGELERFARWLPAEAEALYVPGAFSNGLAEALLSQPRALSLVVPAGTHLLADQPLVDRLLGRGYRFWALAPVKAVALTLNPTSPTGETVPAGEMLAGFRGAFPEMPVFDVEIARQV